MPPKKRIVSSISFVKPAVEVAGLGAGAPLPPPPPAEKKKAAVSTVKYVDPNKVGALLPAHLPAAAPVLPVAPLLPAAPVSAAPPPYVPPPAYSPPPPTAPPVYITAAPLPSPPPPAPEAPRRRRRPSVPSSSSSATTAPAETREHEHTSEPPPSRYKTHQQQQRKLDDPEKARFWIFVVGICVLGITSGIAFRWWRDGGNRLVGTSGATPAAAKQQQKEDKNWVDLHTVKATCTATTKTWTPTSYTDKESVPDGTWDVVRTPDVHTGWETYATGEYRTVPDVEHYTERVPAAVQPPPICREEMVENGKRYDHTEQTAFDDGSVEETDVFVPNLVPARVCTPAPVVYVDAPRTRPVLRSVPITAERKTYGTRYSYTAYKESTTSSKQMLSYRELNGHASAPRTEPHPVVPGRHSIEYVEYPDSCEFWGVVEDGGDNTVWIDGRRDFGEVARKLEQNQGRPLRVHTYVSRWTGTRWLDAQRA